MVSGKDDGLVNSKSRNISSVCYDVYQTVTLRAAQLGENSSHLLFHSLPFSFFFFKSLCFIIDYHLIGWLLFYELFRSEEEGRGGRASKL